MLQVTGTMTDNFDFSLITDFRGYNSTVDQTKVAPEFIVRGSKNVYKKDSGTLANRPGMKRRGSADSTYAGTDSAFVWSTSTGRTYPLRVANSKLQVESDLLSSGTYVWYDLLDSLTLDDFSFDTWWDNTEKKDRILFVKGDDDIQHWSGGIALAAAQGAGGSTLVLADSTSTWVAQGFASNTAGEKKFKIVGSSTEYTYTGGETTNTLTGITPALPAITANDVIVQSVITETNKPVSGNVNDFIKVINNQLYVCSYTSRLVYISDDTDFKDFTVPGTRAAGDPELLTLDEFPKAIAIRQGNAHIFAGTGSLFIIGFQDITVGSSLTQQTIVSKKELGALKAPLGFNFIDAVGDTLIWLSQDSHVRTYGEYRNINEPAFPSISLEIFSELAEVDFTGGHLSIVGDFIYLTSPVSGKVFLYETRKGIDSVGNIFSETVWHAPMIWNVSRVYEINGIVYGFSNANPQVYQLWDTNQWYDDSPSGDELSYDSVARFAYISSNKKQNLICFDKLYSEGYISQGTNLNSYILYDYQGSTAITSQTINSVENPVTFFIGATAPAIGNAPIGDNPLGDGLTEESLDQALLPKFRSIKSVAIQNCFEYQIVIYSQDASSRWELLRLGTNVRASRNEQANFIIR